jgi:predicted dehydrogenase
MGTWRWGIAGTGKIAASFVRDLVHVPDAKVSAVASRTAQGAEAFGAAHGIPDRHASYEALAADPEVDVVYIATPHGRHVDDILLYLEAGKHVLCEKPIALSAAQVDTVVEAAARSGRFVMEALWTRFLPSYVELSRRLDDGAVGQPLVVEGDFGFVHPVDPAHRLFDPVLGGGAILDLGIYPGHLAHLVLGPPPPIGAGGRLASTGVDAAAAAVLTHDGGGLSVVKCALDTALACTARISGTLGAIDVPAMMHCPGELTVRSVGVVSKVQTPTLGVGLHYQVAEVHRCLDAGLTESPSWPLALSRSVLTTLDAIRAAVGVRYPSE